MTRPLSFTAGLAAAFAAYAFLVSCTPVVWYRDGTNQAQFEMDRAHCTLVANTATQRVDHLFASTSNAIADGIVNGLEVGNNFQLCMASLGYQR